jgi:hypothetical protein
MATDSASTCVKFVNMRLPRQLESNQDLIRSWTLAHPKFYGLHINQEFVDALLQTEDKLDKGVMHGLDPRLCRALAAYHGPKGAKVPLVTTTVSGCVRPAFSMLNPWLSPGGNACYDGGCYLYHARAVPAKRGFDLRVRAHWTKRDDLLAAARLSRHFGLPIRDNQTSDGSLSMALWRNDREVSQIQRNLEWLSEAGYSDVPYLCFSSAYVEVTEQSLSELARLPQLVIHVTVSGWHSKEENSLRLREFERYSSYMRQMSLRVVNRQDWAGPLGSETCACARCEEWLLTEVERRGFTARVIRTPYHSVHPFPGGSLGQLGSRYMAGTSYSNIWGRLLSDGARECCTTGKCKSCPVSCGVSTRRQCPSNPLIAARAWEAMLGFESRRQKTQELSPLAVYTGRMLARKSHQAYVDAGDLRGAGRMQDLHALWNKRTEVMNLSSLERRRLANDSHALVVDGMDRHGLWRSALKQTHNAFETPSPGCRW